MTLDRIYEALTSLSEQVGHIDGRLERIEHEVCGNGQPGLSQRVDAVTERLVIAEQGVSDWQRYQRGSFKRSLLQWVVTIVTAAFGSHVPLPPQ